MLRKIEYISLYIFILSLIIVDSFDYILNFLHLQPGKYLYIKTFVHDYIEYFSLLVLSILSFFALAVKRDKEQFFLSLLSAISFILLPIIVYFGLTNLINIFDNTKSIDNYSKVINDSNIPIKKRAMLSKFLAQDIYISKNKIVKIVDEKSGKLIDYKPTKKVIQTSNLKKNIQLKIDRLKFNILINTLIVILSFLAGLTARVKYKPGLLNRN